MTVATYSWRGGRAQRVAEHVTMRAAADALPDGVYTTFRTYSGNRILWLDAHLSRLVESLALTGRPQSLNRAQARACVRLALVECGHALSRVRLTYAHAPGGSQGDLFVTLEPFEPYAAALFAQGVACITVPLRRENPRAKSTAFNIQAAAMYRQLPDGVHEGLMIADDGSVLEGMSSNFFAVMPAGQGGTVLRSEEARVLMGVTRSLVLECATGVIPYVAGAIKQSELARVRECFITSVSREIMPVVFVDGVSMGDGKPGPITRALMARLAGLIEQEALAIS